LVLLAGCRQVDESDLSGKGEGRLEDDVPIYQVQSEEIESGAKVNLRGVVVTAIDTFGDKTGAFWVQEPEGGPFSGVQVFAKADVSAELTVGDIIDLEGGIKKEQGLPEDEGTVTEIVQPQGGKLKVKLVGSGEAPEPVWIDLLAVAADDELAEQWESVLVRVSPARIVDGFTCITSKGECPDDSHQRSRITGPLDIQTSLTAMPEGTGKDTCFQSITGVFDYFFTYKILPRGEQDFVASPANTESEVCLPLEASEEACSDEVDNDKNGQIDCADVACQNATAKCAPSIAKLQQGELPVGKPVELKGLVVTARSKNGKTVWLQDPKAPAGPFNGLSVFQGNALSKEIAPGAIVDVKGTYEEFDFENDAPEGQSLSQLAKPLTFTNIQSGGEIRVSRPASLAEAVTEPWEGVLVELEQVEVVAAAAEGAKLIIRSGDTELQVDEDIVKPEASFAVGQKLRIVGLMTFNSFAPNNKVTIVAQEMQILE
jgi:predicted extracellular nuclease